MKQRFAPAGMLAIAADSFGLDFDVFGRGRDPFEMRGEFAVVAVTGPLMQQASWCWDSYEEIGKRVAAALDSPCPALLLKLCSPGGQVAGAFELSAWIRSEAQRLGKKVFAYVDGIAASAAYALACAADQIIVPPTGLVGSIGCIQVNVDATAQDRALGLSFEMITSGARKADGNPHVALTEESRAAMQLAVDDMATTFFDVVCAARKLAPEAVKSLEASIFVGAKAVAAGLADEVATFAELVAAPATAREQINAGAAGAEADMNEEEKAKAALKAIAEGDDEKAAARAKKALAAYEDEDKGDKKKDEAKAESDDESEKKDGDEKKDTDAKATAKSAPVLALVDKRLASFEERQERKELLASRPDFSAEMVSDLAKQPIDSVRFAVKHHPRGAVRGSTVKDARAAIGAAPSVAQPEQDQVNELDVMMGLARPHAISFDEKTKRHFLGAMTPSEAKAEIARRSAQKGGAA